MNNIKKVITGDWDGEPIWREETSGERLLKVIEEEEKRFKEELVKADSIGGMKHINEFLEKHYKNLNQRLNE